MGVEHNKREPSELLENNELSFDDKLDDDIDDDDLDESSTDESDIEIPSGKSGAADEKASEARRKVEAYLEEKRMREEMDSLFDDFDFDDDLP